MHIYIYIFIYLFICLYMYIISRSPSPAYDRALEWAAQHLSVTVTCLPSAPLDRHSRANKGPCVTGIIDEDSFLKLKAPAEA